MADDNFQITFPYTCTSENCQQPYTEMTQMLLFISLHMYEYFILFSKSPKKNERLVWCL